MNRTPLPSLVRALNTLGEYGGRLDPATATDEQLRIVSEAVEQARTFVAAARGPAAGMHCAEHPGAPADPTHGNACLFCTTRARRRTAAERAPLDDVVRDVAELGQNEATRRHGGPAVARAVAVLGRSSRQHQEADRAALRGSTTGA
ncbi:hypothetical protein [[Kitasatospora] papulosa]|uniref:hypothetical protein n=1 Tax=[Kitasatospora] papulosa TaxID=1464011 RepID=UPI003684B801